MTTQLFSEEKRTTNDSSGPQELSIANLYRSCDPTLLSFSTTDELPSLSDVIGQPRAFRALELGVEVDGMGYNIFVVGIPDSGRTTLTQNYLRRRAANEPVPNDWCYVNNFDNPHQPHALCLRPGWAAALRKDMQAFVDAVIREIPRVFESEEYARERDRLINETKDKIAQEMSNLEEQVGKYNFVIVKTPDGFFFGPGIQGIPLSQKEFEKLSEEQKRKLHQLREKLSVVVEKALTRIREIERTISEELKDLNMRTALFVIQPLIDQLKLRYESSEAAQTYLDQVEKDMVENATRSFMPDHGADGQRIEKEGMPRYCVNVLVDNSGRNGAPVIIENQPTYHNLFGTIEHEIVMNASYTDYTLIHPGAIHRANGGYLILPARDVLINPYAWEGLKRVLRDGSIRVLELGSQMGLISTTSLEPEPIPLDLKVILVGTPVLCYLLRAYDEDFAKLFKVRAEFATEMNRTAESEQEYGLFVKSVVDENHLTAFDRSAVARVIEYGSRLAEDQDKLSTRFGMISDLVRESAYWAKKTGQDVVNKAAVQRAMDERVYRNNLLEEHIQEMIAQDQLMLDVSGTAVGQINALSVLSLGDYHFGRPCRVTASVYAGQAGIIDIERQAKLGGAIHTKGILILSGFLGGRYGQQHPLSLTASLTFEQSYDEIEGDSASAAELLALLSAIADIPIQQGRAMTGSINQHGQIQPIGGVNEKIEGFFRVCKHKGLDGQGVVIPISNQRNLMLQDEVIKAVQQGVFHVWPVRTMDEAISLLTGYEAGQRQVDGTYPPGTFNALMVDRLKSYHRAVDDRPKNSPLHPIIENDQPPT